MEVQNLLMTEQKQFFYYFRQKQNYLVQIYDDNETTNDEHLYSVFVLYYVNVR